MKPPVLFHTHRAAVHPSTSLSDMQALLCREAPSPQGHLYTCALALLHVWLLQRRVGALAAATATPDALSACATMQHAAARQVAGLADDGWDVKGLECEVAGAAGKLARLQGEAAVQESERWQLPQDPEELRPHCVAPAGRLPAYTTAQEEGPCDLAAARARADQNLGSLPALHTCTTFKELTRVLIAAKKGGSQASAAGQHVQLLHRLAGVEALMFRHAAGGFKEPWVNGSERYQESVALQVRWW